MIAACVIACVIVALALVSVGFCWSMWLVLRRLPPVRPPPAPDTEPEGTPYTPEENAAWEQHVARWRQP